MAPTSASCVFVGFVLDASTLELFALLEDIGCNTCADCGLNIGPARRNINEYNLQIFHMSEYKISLGLALLM